MTVFFNTAFAELKLDNGWPAEWQFIWWQVAEPEDIQKFIDNGADVNAILSPACCYSGEGPSVLAVAAGYTQNSDVIKLLIKSGAKVNQKTKSRGDSSHPWAYSTPLGWALSNPTNHRILIENGAVFNDDIDDYYMMEIGYGYDNSKIEYLLDSGLFTKSEVMKSLNKAKPFSDWQKLKFEHFSAYKPKKLAKEEIYTYPGYMSCLERENLRVEINEFEINNTCDFPIVIYVCSVSNSENAVMNNRSSYTGETIQCGKNNRKFQTVEQFVEVRGGRFEWFACHARDSILYNKTNTDKFACKSNYKQIHDRIKAR